MATQWYFQIRKKHTCCYPESLAVKILWLCVCVSFRGIWYLCHFEILVLKSLMTAEKVPFLQCGFNVLPKSVTKDLDEAEFELPTLWLLENLMFVLLKEILSRKGK